MAAADHVRRLRDDAARRALPRMGAFPRPLAWLLGLAVLVRVPLLVLPGYPWDMHLFATWAEAVARDGLSAAISRPDIDYVGYNYVLGPIASAYTAVTGRSDLASDEVFLRLMKLPALAGDLAVIALLYAVVRSGAALATTRAATTSAPASERVAVIAAALYALNPAVLYDSAYWGQVDSVVTAFMLGAVAALLYGRPALAAALLTTGFLVKPHPIVLVPLIAWLTWRRFGLRGVIRGAAAGAATLAAGLGYFVLSGDTGTVISIYRDLFEVSDQVSVSAWNPWWLVYRFEASTYPHDVLVRVAGFEVTIATLSKLLLASVVVLVPFLVRGERASSRVLVAAALLVFAFFMLTMKMHERYLFPLLALLAPVAATSVRWRVLYALLSLTLLANLAAIYPLPPGPKPQQLIAIAGVPLDVIVSAANVVLFAAFLAFALAEARPTGRSSELRPRPPRVLARVAERSREAS